MRLPARARTAAPYVAAGLAAVLAVGAHLWFETRVTAESTHREIVDATADGGTIAGQHLTLTRADLDQPGLESPAGTRTVSVYLDAESGDDAKDCATPRLFERGGSARSWDEMTLRATSGTAEDPTTCTQEGGRYRIHTVFIVPDDAAGPFVLEIGEAIGSDAIRFDLDL